MKVFRLYFVLILIALALQPGRWERPQPQLEAWLLDVGQGESFFLRAASGETLLFDGGPSDRVLSQIGDLLPPWQRHIDLLVLSHPHQDHIRGLISILNRFTVGKVWTSGANYNSADFKAWKAELARQKTPEEVVFAPHTVPWGNFQLRVQHPTRNMKGESPSQIHDTNLSVQLLQGNTGLIFLTGDLNEEHEHDMLTNCRLPSCNLKSLILQVPHHGSASGLIPAFLEAVQPAAALIPVGTDNRFNHPRQEILDRLASYPVYRTDQQGRITIKLIGQKVQISPSRNGVVSWLAVPP